MNRNDLAWLDRLMTNLPVRSSPRVFGTDFSRDGWIFPFSRAVSDRFRLAVVGLAAFGLNPPGKGADSLAVNGPTLELPKYTVTGMAELPAPESWRYAELPGFVVLSNASEAKTRRLLEGFELFRYAVGIVWPIPDRTSVPVSIIVCGTRSNFEDFIPAAERSRSANVASMLLRDHEHGAIVLDAQSALLPESVVSGDPSQDQLGYEMEPADLLCREYVRFLLSRKDQQMPVWMEEGMIQILLAMRVTREQIVFGKIEDPTLANSREFISNQVASQGGSEPVVMLNAMLKPPVEDRDFNHVFKTRRLMPLDQFFAVTRASPEAGRLYGDNRWVKQAYAFVHMCLFGRGGRFQKPFTAFLQRAAREPVTEAVFKECFGLDYRQMGTELQIYTEFTDHRNTEYNFKKGKELPAPTPLMLREAEEFESARIKGDALLLGGHLDEARAALLPAYQRGARDPRLLATLGLYERAAGHNDRARKFLEAAVAGRVVRPEAWLELARLRYTEAVAKPAAEGDFSAEQVAGITSLLYVARHQPPHQPALYVLLAETWQRSAVKIGRDDALVLIQGATLFPNDLKLVYQTAVFAIETGILDAAQPLIDHGLRHAADIQVRTRFEQIKATLTTAGK